MARYGRRWENVYWFGQDADDWAFTSGSGIQLSGILETDDPLSPGRAPEKPVTWGTLPMIPDEETCSETG